MHTGKLVFSQLTNFLPMHTFRRVVQKYHGDKYAKSFSCLDQYLAMSFAQLTGRESLRDIEACLFAHKDKLFHMGLRSKISRATLADANKTRNWKIYADFTQSLIKIAQLLYARLQVMTCSEVPLRSRLFNYRFMSISISMDKL